ncbi:serpentine type 7TM GPCR chemoreceptor srbc domain-containing protein [Ditylenchus destructor]|uniref:Serpentine type 7TM GPCR chemoreceptor srbc domain-containing protein n=1 Tax=Ditylenchus destructor TaxID=166010 RepID=A0AAD4NEW5_9BILA|nr:serpentine type 7TM GPCR chemoreceptor srbc domain-containing protein [Ditylenchus destructor]
MQNGGADLHQIPDVVTQACQAFGCLLTHQTEFITFRLVFAILNTAAELTFLYKLLIFRKKSFNGKSFNNNRATSFANKANQIVLIIVISDFVLNFIPQLATLVVVQFPFRKILARIGPYNSVLCGLDVLITAITYTRVLGKTAPKESSIVTTTRVNRVKA